MSFSDTMAHCAAVSPIWRNGPRRAAHAAAPGLRRRCSRPRGRTTARRRPARSRSSAPRPAPSRPPRAAGTTACDATSSSRPDQLHGTTSRRQFGRMAASVRTGPADHPADGQHAQEHQDEANHDQLPPRRVLGEGLDVEGLDRTTWPARRGRAAPTRMPACIRASAASALARLRHGDALAHHVGQVVERLGQAAAGLRLQAERDREEGVLRQPRALVQAAAAPRRPAGRWRCRRPPGELLAVGEGISRRRCAAPRPSAGRRGSRARSGPCASGICENSASR